MKKLLLLLTLAFAIPASATCNTPGGFKYSSGNGGITIPGVAGCTIVITYAEFGISTSDNVGTVYSVAALITDKDCLHTSTAVILWQRALGVSQWKPSDGVVTPATAGGNPWNATNDVVGNATCVGTNGGSNGYQTINVVGKYQ